MSQSRNQYEAERWLLTAKEDLLATETLASAGIYALACFHAQQAAEKALKALWRLIRRGSLGTFSEEVDYGFPAEGYDRRFGSLDR